MNSRKFKFWLAAATALNLGTAGQAMAAGYEKSIPWGGRSAGVAGIATPYIQGSQALFFNPAGLVSDSVQQDVSLNLSPTWAKFEGPVYTNNPPTNGTVIQASGERAIITPFGLIYGATPTEQFGFGIGGYVSGGSNAIFENVELGRLMNPNIRTKIQVIELALGAGYKVTPELKIGAAYRIAFVTANFASLGYAGPANFNLETGDLKDTKGTGFKLGAQYKAGANTLLGLTFRSDIQFNASGDFDVRLDNTATVNTVQGGGLTASSRLPLAVVAGLQHDFVPNEWRLLLEYAFTNYSKVDRIAISGTNPVNGTALPDFETNWKDQHNVRIGGEYLGLMMPIRAGYVWTNTVTDAAYARPTFTPPGNAHTVTLGTGFALTSISEKPLQFDIAGEYTWVKGDGDASSPQPLLSPQGEYKTSAYALHAGLTWAF